MHEYTTSYHDRKLAYYLLAILSSIVGIGVSFLLDAISDTSGIAIAAPSGLLLFGMLFLLFDRFVWRWSRLYKFGLVKIPDLNGDWTAVIYSFRGKKIEAAVKIYQTYSKISIYLKTAKSDSLSQMAAIDMVSPNMFILRYEYSAEFKRDEAANILRHYGVTCVRLKSNDHRFLENHSANYYTEERRDSHGEITFSRVVKNEG